MKMDKKDMKRMAALRSDIKLRDDMLAKSNLIVSKRQKKKHQEKKDAALKELEEFRIKYDDPNIDAKAQQELIENSRWTKAGNALENAGNKMDSVGRKMQKAGLKTTAIVWTPVLYGGYKIGKSAFGKDKTANNNSPEQEFIGLINECEQAFKDGKIDEATMKFYIQDFANTKYRE